MTRELLDRIHAMLDDCRLADLPTDGLEILAEIEEVLKQPPVAYAVVDKDGHIEWVTTALPVAESWLKYVETRTIKPLHF